MGKNVSFRAGLGYGWRTNYNQRVYVWEKDSDFYIWEDEDGTDHYFEKQSDGTYKDEDGLELTLTDTGSGTEKYIIQDKNGNKTYFDSLGRLTKISNNQETVSSITVSYTSADSLLISTVTDGVGRVYHYTYNTDNLLTCLSYRGTGVTDLFAVTYGYTDGMLTAITDQDAETVSYSYNTDYHYLTSASDIDGYKITYEYTRFAEGKPSRVSKVQEFDGTASGGVLTIAYGMNETTFTDKLGNVQILQFNNWGNTMSIQDGEGRAQFAQYATDESDTGKGNQLTLSSKLQNTVVNLLDNGSFENSSCEWYDADDDSALTPVTTQAYLGSKSLSIPAGSGATRDELSLEAGETYTFSVFVKGNSTVQLELRHSGGILVTGESISVTSEWTRVQLSCTNPNSTALQIVPVIRNTGTGTIYADCAQLEKAPTASRYNLIQNGDFQTSGQWTATNSATGDGKTTVTSPAPKLDSNVYAIVGNPSKQKNIYQTVSVSGSAGDSFVLGGWAKGDAVPIKENRAYGLYAIFHYTDGSESEAMMAAFNPDTNGWQYTAVAIVAEKDYSSIDIYACYDRGANTVCFDGIQLFKEAFGTSFAYDGEGNVERVTDIQGKETLNTYSNTNDLLSTILPDGTTFTYQYDNYHNVISARSNEGVIYTFEYDTYGNNTAISVTQDGIKLIATADYTDDGNRLESVTDTSGSTTRYSYNANTNMLEWVQYPEDTEATRTTYSYDEMYRAISVIINTDTGKTMSAQYEYTDDYLTSIITPSTTYTFDYGDFGLRTNLKIGDQPLATYEYDTYNRLKKLAYGNLDMVVYTYDAQGRVTQETYEDGATVSYTYDNTGALATVVDSKTGITTTYYYDLIDRLVMYEEKRTGFSHSVKYLYNDKNKLQTLTETIDGVTTVYNYMYDADDRVISVSIGNGEDVVSTVTYSYDTLGRMSQQVLQHGNEVIATKSSVFSDISNTTTSLRLESYNGLTYTYDLNGNITSISDGTNCTTYEYDSIGQLLRENNEALDKTWRWTYDDAGNIQTREEYNYTLLADPSQLNHTTIEYGYDEEGAWGDLLTTYDSMEIEYDAIGNPTKFGDWELDWQHGRQLAGLETEDGAYWEFLYNADGMRVMRATGDVNYHYVYNGSQLARLKADSNTLHFTYDATGTPLTVSLNGTVYYYSVNLQGDIVAILDNTGAAVVNYTYDAWGNPGSVTGSLATTLGFLNPLRYRGYIYDTETGLYYLQSRYYHPQTGRFINADGMISSGHGIYNNLFTYCKNDPVNHVDLDGCSSVWWMLLQICQMGYIHMCVELDILANNPGAEKELWLSKDGELIGRADIMYGNVVWEIKHAGSQLATAILRGEQAISQADGYKGATAVRLRRKVAGLGPAGMFSGEFTVTILEHAYCVTYDTPADGVILYYIEDIKYEKEYSYDFAYVPAEQEQVTSKPAYSSKPQYTFNRGSSMQNNFHMSLGGAIGGAIVVGCLLIAPLCLVNLTNR